MIGAALHDAIAGVQLHFAFLHQHVHRAGYHDQIIDRVGLVHGRMLGGIRGARLMRAAELAERGAGIDLRPGAFRRNLHHAEDGAGGRGIVSHRPQRAVRGAEIANGHFVGNPDLGNAGARPALERVHIGRVIVEQDDGLARRVVPGHDPADLLQHSLLPLIV